MDKRGTLCILTNVPFQVRYYKVALTVIFVYVACSRLLAEQIASELTKYVGETKDSLAQGVPYVYDNPGSFPALTP
jgi:hypothetical protein